MTPGRTWRRLRDAAAPAVDLARTYGARGLARRALHEVRLRSGGYDEPDVVVGGGGPVVLLPVDVAAARRVLARYPEAGQRAVDQAHDILAGRTPFFGGPALPIGWPPRWHQHPRTGEVWPSARPWTAYAHSPPGDIKWIWEPSRFHFAWLFARAWAVTGDRRFADETWRGFSDWLTHNPAGRGAGWYCAQELSLRCFAILFAAGALAGEGVTGAAALQQVGELVRLAGHRISRTLGHALSQRNNHGLSESVGLWTLSHVAGDEPAAARWRAQAQAGLRECLVDQFASDGAYIQESLNYHRLAVHVLLWARFVSRALAVPLADEVEPALRRSYELLRGLVPPGGSELPNYGHNDGALLLALSSADYRDVRPTLAHLARELGEPSPLPPGPWDEPAAWLGLGDAPRPTAPSLPETLRITGSGYVSSRRGDWMVFSRLPRHRHHRPAHADALHVDVWRAGRNLAPDPGTYSYSDPPPWDNALAATRVHNTCSIGERSQMRRRGRFLWTHWTSATLHAHHDAGGVSRWLASVRCAWGRNVVHTRLVHHTADQLDVLDHLGGGDGREPLRLHWNLDGTGWRRDGERWHDSDIVVSIEAPSGTEYRDVRGDPASTLGWASPTYGFKVACTAIEAERVAPETWFHTVFAITGRPVRPLDDAMMAAWRRGEVLVAADPRGIG